MSMKIWLDFCEPKSVTMLRPLYENLIDNYDIFITARDFDSTYYLLDQWNIDYIPVGKYGGRLLEAKLIAHSERLLKLTKIIIKKKPDFLFCITSPEAMRISFGLQIPNIMFNDEPRSYGPCSTTFPYVDQLIIPKCIPIEWYLNYGLKREKIIRFNGIDEVGWLNPDYFTPNINYIKTLNLTENNYVLCRTEPTKAGYLISKMQPHETQLTEILPDLIDHTKDIKYIILVRNEEQLKFLKKKFDIYIKKDDIRIYRGLENLAHLIYFARAVISGGGTMVRESALLGVPSIEFFPLETYPQEKFLIENGFPLQHVKDTSEIVSLAFDYILKDFRINTKKKVLSLENPIKIGLREFNKRTHNKISN